MLRLLGSLLLFVFLGACAGETVDLDAGGGIDPDAASVAMDATVVADGGRADEGLDADAGSAVDAVAPVDAGPVDELVVMTTAGPTRGTEDQDLRVFRGIPYAEPPTGARRFAPPVPVMPWPGTHQADDYGPGCPQARIGPEFLLGDFAGPTSEDCLSLNVWAHSDGKPRPVMVFIHGGAFVLGASAWPIYDGAALARTADVTVVSINYRLGVLGYLATEALAAAGGAGNYAVLDQIESLRWVRDNIAAFGGDPENVTVFGESAGAISVCALLAAPVADDLFAKAIVQSGACSIPDATQRVAVYPPSYEGGAALVEEIGCADENDVLRCLRTKPVEDLVNVAGLRAVIGADIAAVSAMMPHVDGEVIVMQPLLRLEEPGADKPLIVGSNEDEGLLFAGSDLVLTRIGLRNALEDLLGDAQLAEQVEDLYPRLRFSANEAWIAFLGESVFICPGLAAAARASGGAPSFTYHFTRSPLLTRAVGVPHGIELVYLFDTFGSMAVLPTRRDRAVSERMQMAWGAFAHDGVPQLSPTWPAYEPASGSVAILDEPAEVVGEIRDGRCEALGNLGVFPR